MTALRPAIAILSNLASCFEIKDDVLNENNSQQFADELTSFPRFTSLTVAIGRFCYGKAGLWRSYGAWASEAGRERVVNMRDQIAKKSIEQS